MPEPATAVTVGGSIAGAAISADGASSAAASAEDAQMAMLAFEQQRYDDWNAIYGDIEEGLAEYYENLTPERFITSSTEAYEKEYAAAKERVRENLTARGIRFDSGPALAINADMELNRAENRANIRANAEQEVVNRKQGFLSIGLQSNPADSVSAANRAVYQNAQQNSNLASAAAGQAVGTAISETTTALADYFRGDE